MKLSVSRLALMFIAALSVSSNSLKSLAWDEVPGSWQNTCDVPNAWLTYDSNYQDSKILHGSFAQRTDVEISTIDGIRVSTPYGWGLLRASNTQAVLCLRFESDTHEGLCHLKKDFFEIMSNHFDEQLLAELK